MVLISCEAPRYKGAFVQIQLHITSSCLSGRKSEDGNIIKEIIGTPETRVEISSQLLGSLKLAHPVNPSYETDIETIPKWQLPLSLLYGIAFSQQHSNRRIVL
ncbi:hypothetical protein T07_11563 [Trichinella nelsoni]|uniref:Uncharacterized protein n=1 Tax=Trichinella nelsoni TaxID=6336 RepID=A0A0V0RDK1_9BILA|nr:hypothetical protein T07_11563 [Trichinella nelsoni]